MMMEPPSPRPLDDADRTIWDWQFSVPGFGERGQEHLKGASVMVSRVGGLGGIVAYELAAAGVGRLVLAHAGDVKPSDLNRQLLMTHDAIGTSRLACAVHRLKELNPRLDVLAVEENVSDANVAGLVAEADVVVDCAPLFVERFAMNREAIRQGKPLVECAMYELQGQVTTVLPGTTPCLACLYPEPPPAWKREFPVFGAVSGAIGCIGAMEAIKLLSGLGEPLAGRMLSIDLRDVRTQEIQIHRRPGCPVCAEA